MSVSFLFCREQASHNPLLNIAFYPVTRAYETIGFIGYRVSPVSKQRSAVRMFLRPEAFETMGWGRMNRIKFHDGMCLEFMSPRLYMSAERTDDGRMS